MAPEFKVKKGFLETIFEHMASAAQAATDSQRKAWLQDEDDQLRDLVGRFGTQQWTLIATHLFGRNGKQCRER
jgi:hypothetical protein